MVYFTIGQIFLISIFIVIIGLLANISGYGGGVLLVPMLSLLFNVPLKLVIGSTLAALTFPTTIGFLKAWRRNEVDFRLGIALEIPIIIGVITGAKFTSYMDENVLELIFGTVALCFSIFMIYGSISNDTENMEERDNIFDKLSSIPPYFVIERKDYSTKLSIPIVLIMGLGIGFVAGMLGIGGGWMKSPVLILMFGLPPVMGSGTSLFMLSMTTISGGLSHFLEGNFSVTLFLTIAISMVIGTLIGDYYKERLENKHISYIITASLLIVGLVMLIKGMDIY